MIVPAQISVILAGLSIADPALETARQEDIDASYFEGRWSFEDETCDSPNNWTMIAGGSFVSADVTGIWKWDEGRLTLNLVDLAIDEETGEIGGKFQMDGPVQIVDENTFTMAIMPDVYMMKRCPN